VRRVGGTAPDAVEVAVLRGSEGTWRFALWEPQTRVDARTDVEVDGERWVVVDLQPGKRGAGVRVFEKPPHDEIGSWSPLVTVPD
jgi:hypothetical protein